MPLGPTRSGSQCEVFPNGNTYDGEWVNDMKEGADLNLSTSSRGGCLGIGFDLNG